MLVGLRCSLIVFQAYLSAAGPVHIFLPGNEL